jgi:hypothetical protein
VESLRSRSLPLFHSWHPASTPPVCECLHVPAPFHSRWCLTSSALHWWCRLSSFGLVLGGWLSLLNNVTTSSDNKTMLTQWWWQHEDHDPAVTHCSHNDMAMATTTWQQWWRHSDSNGDDNTVIVMAMMIWWQQQQQPWRAQPRIWNTIGIGELQWHWIRQLIFSWKW